MPTAEGPCRFGQYAPYLRQILDANGYERRRDPLAHQPERLPGPGRAGRRLRAHRLARAAGGRPASETAAPCTGPYEQQRAMPRRSTKRSLADLCRTIENDARGAGAAAARAARVHGALPRPLPQGADARRDRDAPADRRGGRDLLPPEHFLQREPGALPGGVRRRGVAQRHRGVDLVHQLRALPQAQAGRPAALRWKRWARGCASACRSATSTS